MAHDVFISYAIENKSVADAVCEALEKGGVRCWCAPRDVPYAVDYEEAIVDAISGSKLMVLILSSHSNDSPHVKREVQNACREEPQIQVLPFQVEDITLNKSLRYYIGSVNWLSALTPPLEDHLNRLVKYVQLLLMQHKQDRDTGTQGSQGTKEDGEMPQGRDKDRRRMMVVIFFFTVILAVITPVIWKRTSDDKLHVVAAEVAPDLNNRQLSWSQATSLNPQPPPGMAYVSGGKFMMGRNDGDEYERPAHEAIVQPFFLDLYEVTNEEYEKFTRAKGRRYIPQGWSNGTYPVGAGRKPVTGVTWDAANAYAKWAGKRLPTEEEWEFAARGSDGRRYPWGNEWRAGLANANGASGVTADVGTYKGASPFGVFDMVGNVWEWTDSGLKAYPGGQLPKQPPGDMHVIRGGSHAESNNAATTTYRRGYPARGNYYYDKTGFRCAQDVMGSSK